MRRPLQVLTPLELKREGDVHLEGILMGRDMRKAKRLTRAVALLMKPSAYRGTVLIDGEPDVLPFGVFTGSVFSAVALTVVWTCVAALNVALLVADVSGWKVGAVVVSLLLAVSWVPTIVYLRRHRVTAIGEE